MENKLPHDPSALIELSEMDHLNPLYYEFEDNFLDLHVVSISESVIDGLAYEGEISDIESEAASRFVDFVRNQFHPNLHTPRLHLVQGSMAAEDAVAYLNTLLEDFETVHPWIVAAHNEGNGTTRSIAARVIGFRTYRQIDMPLTIEPIVLNKNFERTLLPFYFHIVPSDSGWFDRPRQ